METPPLTAPLARLSARLPELMPHDRHRLQRRIDGARRIRNPKAVEAIAAELTAEIETAALKVEARRAGVPRITYPENLPVSGRRDDIAKAISENQVVVIAG